MKPDWYLRFSWLLVLTAVILICSYFIVNNINSCTAQPLEYAVKQAKERFDVDLVYGRMTLTNTKDLAYDYIEFGDINVSTSSELGFEIHLNSSLLKNT